MAANFIPRSASSPALHAALCPSDSGAAWPVPHHLGLLQNNHKMAGPYGPAFSPRQPQAGGNAYGHFFGTEVSLRSLSARASAGSPMSSSHNRRQNVAQDYGMGRIHSSDDVLNLDKQGPMSRVSSSEEFNRPTEPCPEAAVKTSSGNGGESFRLIPLSLLRANVQHFVSGHGGFADTVSAVGTTGELETLPLRCEQASIRKEADGSHSEDDAGPLPVFHESLFPGPDFFPSVVGADKQASSGGYSLYCFPSSPELNLAWNGEDNSPSDTGPPNHPEVTDEYYSKALASDPDNSLILRNYARFLIQTREDYVGAERFLERAILVCPADADVLVQYAKLLWEFRGDADRAAMYFERAVQAAPDDCYVLAAYASFLWSVEASPPAAPAVAEPTTPGFPSPLPA